MKFIVKTAAGSRTWEADDHEHAREQHIDAFPDERIISILGPPAPKPITLHLNPEDIRDAYDGYEGEDAEWVVSATEERLREVGEWVLDTIYDEYRDLLKEAIRIQIEKDEKAEVVDAP